MINRLSAILLIVVGSVLIAYSSPIFFFTYSSFLLPTNVIPSSYNITLIPDLQKFKFEGYVDIALQVKENVTRTIILHWLDLTLVDMEFSETSGEIIAPQAVTFDLKGEFMVIIFGRFLAVESYKLKIVYTGDLNTAAVGLFRGSYVNDLQQIRWFVATRFEPNYARMAFPCFDEPALKATFQINLGRHEEDFPSYHTVSNMKLLDTRVSGKNILDVFEQTPVMSTYLLSFVICDFTYFATADGKIRLYVRKELNDTNEADFAIQMSSRIIQQLENYTETTLSFEKLDQIAIPDLNFITTENLGSVMYNEDDVLMSDLFSTTKSKQETLMTISREYARQLFGNLVTPKLWQYLWLKEGFATIIGLHVADMVKPEWRIKEQFLEDMHSCFRYDSELIKPLSFDVTHPRQIEEKFNSISHYKAGVVLHMLEHMITPDVFRRTVIKIFNEREEYKVTNSSDVWKAIEATLKPDIQNWCFLDSFRIYNAMESWEKKSGYPVVTVIRNYRTGRVDFTQKIFYIDGTVPEETWTSWYIPINWSVQDHTDFGNTRGNMWLTYKPLWFLVPNLTEKRWLIVNNRATGYYRVHYDEANWKLIANYLNTSDYKEIDPLNRAQLIDDAFNLARSGLLKYEIAFMMTNYLHRETDYIVHSALFRVFEFLDTKIANHPLYYKFQRRVVTILEETLNKLDYTEIWFNDKDQHINNMHRHYLIYWSCLMKSEKCLTTTNEKLNDYFIISNDLQVSVVCGALRRGNLTIWNSVDARIPHLDSRSQSRLKYALGCSENYDILKKYIEREIDQKNLMVFKNIYNKGIFGKRFVEDYVCSNFRKIYQAFQEDTGKIIVGLSSLVTTEDIIFEFKDDHKFPFLTRSFETARKNIMDNAKWVNTYLPDVTTWLNTLP